MDKDSRKQVEDKLALIESNLRAVREYLDERMAEVQQLSDEIMEIIRKG